jgi:uracil-DNA glycosylase
MRSNCRPFLLTQLKIVKPELLVLLGSFALKAYVELRGGKSRSAVLGQYVGRVDHWGDKRVIALGHTSGRSLWPNEPANMMKQAQANQHLSSELTRLISGLKRKAEISQSTATE